MEKTINKLQRLLDAGQEYIATTSAAELAEKPNPEKWSKKEIIGHLIDSGIANLQRFTEIQFEEKPYKINQYNQNSLVVANDYQNAETKEIGQFWVSINNRIKNVIKQQSEESLNYKIEFYDGKVSDLRFLMNDYVEHLEHHLNQVIKNNS